MSLLASDWCFWCGETRVESASEPWGQPSMGGATTPPHRSAPEVCRTWVPCPRLCPASPPGPPASVAVRDARWKGETRRMRRVWELERGPSAGETGEPRPRAARCPPPAAAAAGVWVSLSSTGVRLGTRQRYWIRVPGMLRLSRGDLGTVPQRSRLAQVGRSPPVVYTHKWALSTPRHQRKSNSSQSPSMAAWQEHAVGRDFVFITTPCNL